MRVTHPQLRPGDACPGCKQGKLYALKQLGQLVRITAQPLFAATRFELEKLRCNLCGQTLHGPSTAGGGAEKSTIRRSAPCWGICALARACPTTGWTECRPTWACVCPPPRNGNSWPKPAKLSNRCMRL